MVYIELEKKKTILGTTSKGWPPLRVSLFTEFLHLALKLNNLFRYSLTYGFHFFSNMIHFFQLLDYFGFKPQHSLELVREPLVFTRHVSSEARVIYMAAYWLAYSYDRASTSCSGMTGLLQDVFTCETPMTPAEVAHLVKAEEIQCCLRYISSTNETT